MEGAKIVEVTLVLVLCITTMMRTGDSFDASNDAKRKLCLLKCMGICTHNTYIHTYLSIAYNHSSEMKLIWEGT